MTVLNGHFDGRGIVLDQPMPAEVPPQTPVKVVVEQGDARTVLAEIAKLAVEDDLPADYAAQHEHYVKGTPRR